MVHSRSDTRFVSRKSVTEPDCFVSAPFASKSGLSSGRQRLDSRGIELLSRAVPIVDSGVLERARPFRGVGTTVRALSIGSPPRHTKLRGSALEKPRSSRRQDPRRHRAPEPRRGHASGPSPMARLLRRRRRRRSAPTRLELCIGGTLVMILAEYLTDNGVQADVVIRAAWNWASARTDFPSEEVILSGSAHPCLIQTRSKPI